jgi:hypothetical protein
MDNVTDEDLHDLGRAIGVQYDKHGMAIPDRPWGNATKAELQDFANALRDLRVSLDRRGIPA